MQVDPLQIARQLVALRVPLGVMKILYNQMYTVVKVAVQAKSHWMQQLFVAVVQPGSIKN